MSLSQRAVSKSVGLDRSEILPQKNLLPEEIFAAAGLSEHEQPRKRRRVPKILGGLALGITLLYLGGDLAWEHYNHSGELAPFPAKCNDPPPSNTISEVTWNVKKLQSSQTRKLKLVYALETQIHPYIANLQEVTYPAAKKIARTLNGQCITVIYAEADTEVHNNIGNLGNAILIREKPDDIEVHSLPGTSYNDTLWRLAKSAWYGFGGVISGKHNPWKRTDAAWQEKRVVETVKFKVNIDGHTEYMTSSNTHITSTWDDSPLHYQQLGKTMHYVREDTSNNTTELISGDFNSPNHAIDPYFQENGFIPLVTGSTSPTGGTIDHIAYKNSTNSSNTAPKLSYCQAYVLNKYLTDHKAEEVICRLGGSAPKS